MFRSHHNLLLVLIVCLAVGCTGKESPAATVDATITAGERVMVIDTGAAITNDAGDRQVVRRGSFWKVRGVRENAVLVNGHFFDGWISRQSVCSPHTADSVLAAWERDSRNNVNTLLTLGIANYLRDEPFIAIRYLEKAVT